MKGLEQQKVALDVDALPWHNTPKPSARTIGQVTTFGTPSSASRCAVAACDQKADSVVAQQQCHSTYPATAFSSARHSGQQREGYAEVVDLRHVDVLTQPTVRKPIDPPPIVEMKVHGGYGDQNE